MGRLYWLLSVCLLFASLTATSWLMQRDPGSVWRLPPADADGQDAADGILASAAVAASLSPSGGLSQKAIDELWKRTLFREERTEQISGAQDPEEADEAVPASGVQMELIGVGRIGGKPVAIILVKRASARASGRTKTPTRAGLQANRRAKTAAKAAEPQAESSATEGTRHVYKVGDEVEKTGYIVEEILFSEVRLMRGGVELLLSLDAKDSESGNRRTREAADVARRTQQQTAKQTAQTMAAGGSTASPPPPPVTPGTGKATTGSTPQAPKLGKTGAGTRDGSRPNVQMTAEMKARHKNLARKKATGTAN